MKVSVYRIQLVRERSEDYRFRQIGRINSSQRAVESACQLFSFVEELATEAFWVLGLDTKLKPIGICQVSVGTLDASLVHPRGIFQAVYEMNAASFLAIHNHPSGELEPSRQDIDLTRRLRELGQLLGVPMVDHIIVAPIAYGQGVHAYSILEHHSI